MLMDIKCSAVTSVAVHLTFDDNSIKDRTISVNDLISVEYNKNGLRRHIEGKVIHIQAIGTDPKSWTITVDGSNDFDSETARFSPMSILDIEIIRKADTIKYIETPMDNTGIVSLRVVNNRLQFSQDGINWNSVIVDRRNIHIKEEEGTFPQRPPYGICPSPNDDIIKDEEI